MSVHKTNTGPRERILLNKMKEFGLGCDGDFRERMEQRQDLFAARHMPAGELSYDKWMSSDLGVGKEPGEFFAGFSEMVNPDGSVDQDHRLVGTPSSDRTHFRRRPAQERQAFAAFLGDKRLKPTADQ